MNERLAAGLFAGISITLIGAEIVLAARYGFDPGLILFCLSLYAGAAGVLFSLRNLFNADRGSGHVESVSERRARAMRGEGGADMLRGYDVDEEFIGRGHKAGKPSHSHERMPDDETLRAAVASYAEMAGGLVKLRETLMSIDDAAFRTMARSAGMAGVTRERAIALVSEMITVEASSKQGGEEAPSLSISLDRETFDDYIKRCMSERDSDSDEETAGGSYSVGLDAAGLSRMPGEPPTEFSHKPDAVRAKSINTPGGAR